MFKEIKLPFNLSLLDALSISTFVAIGYSILYKYAFYAELNITWYMYSLQPSYIFFSSIKFIFLILLGFFLGIVIIKPISNFYRIFAICSIIAVVNALIQIFVPETWLSKSQKIGIIVIFVGFSVASLVKMLVLNYQMYRTDNLYKYYTILIMSSLILLLIISLPSMLGKKEARQLFSNINYNLVHLKNVKEEWVLVELNGDKALIMNKKDHKVFKLIEYKDIDIIRVE